MITDKILYDHIMAADGWLYPTDGRDPAPGCARPHIKTIITELERRVGLTAVIESAPDAEFEDDD